MHETAVESDTALRNSSAGPVWSQRVVICVIERNERREKVKWKHFFLFPCLETILQWKNQQKVNSTNTYVLSETFLSCHLLESSGCFEMKFVVFKVQLPWKSLQT